MLKFNSVDRAFQGGTAVYGELAGSIDANSLPEFRRQLQAFLDKGRRHVVILAEELKYVNSSGLGALIKIASDLNQEGGAFSMVRVPAKILALFKMLGILDVIQVFDGVDAAFRALESQVAPPPPPARREFPLLIRCIACRRKIEIPTAGYFRCPRCGACYSVKSDGKVKGYQIDQPQSMELRIPCVPDAASIVQAASTSLVRLKEIPEADSRSVQDILEKACSLAWDGSSAEDQCAIYLVADRKEFRGAIKVNHGAFKDRSGLQAVREKADEMDIVTLPSGAQILKFTRKIQR